MSDSITSILREALVRPYAEQIAVLRKAEADLLRENAELRANYAQNLVAYKSLLSLAAQAKKDANEQRSVNARLREAHKAIVENKQNIHRAALTMRAISEQALAEIPAESLAAITAPLEAQIADLVAALNEAISLIDEKLLCVNPNLVPKGLVMKWEDCIAQSPAQSLAAIQDAARANLLKRIAALENQVTDLIRPIMEDAEREIKLIDAARAEERAACGQDTERIDQMEQHHIEMHCFGGPDLYHEGIEHPYEWTVGKNREFGWGPRMPSLREAIDGYTELRNRGNSGEAKCE